MNRIAYLFNKRRFKPQEKISEWGNKISLEHKQILSQKQEVICEYIRFQKIEKTCDWRYDHEVEWNYNDQNALCRAAATTCARCFGNFSDGEFTVPHNDILVTQGKDMIPSM
jgi:PHP family Zn ribbon phosphoesterase